MSVKVMGWVWDQDIPRDEKFVLLAYADHAEHDGTSIYPAIATVAKKTGYSERSVQRITRKLEDGGWLISDGEGPHGQNRWRIAMIEGGDKLAPLPDERVTSPTSGGDKSDGQGVTDRTEGVTNGTFGGDTAMAPDSSINPSPQSSKDSSFKRTPEKTAFPQVQENLRPILDSFMNVAGFDAGPTLRKSWIAGAHALQSELYAAGTPEAEHAEFVEWAVRQMRKDFAPNAPVIKSPGSMVYLVRPRWLKAQKAKAETKDFWDD